MASIIEPEGRVFHTLDALRGFAAIGVVVFHMSGAFAPLAAPGGYLSVDLFFMMSGVVLSHAYEVRFRAGMRTLDFMRVRLIRLYPLYLLGTLFGLAVTMASLRGHNSQNWDPKSLAQAALMATVMIPNFSTKPVNEMFPLNIACWSLFFEIVVNLLFVMVWPLLTSRRLAAVCLLSALAVVWVISQAGSIDQGSIASSFPAGLARTVFGFSAGVWIARGVPNIPRRESNLAVLAIAAAVTIAISGRQSGVSRAFWDAGCVLLVFPLLIHYGTIIDPGPRFRKIAIFLGITSYAVYVLHSPLTSVLNSVSKHFAVGALLGIGAPYVGLVMLSVLLAGSWLVDRYVDVPARRLLSRRVPKIIGWRAVS